MGACDFWGVSSVCAGVQNAGDAAGALGDFVSGVGSAAGEVMDFASDPLGYMAEKAHGGAKGLADTVLPAIAKSLHPNLSADWFLRAYAATWGLAILAWIAQLLWGMVQTSRRQIAPSQMVDIMVWRSPLFLAGCAFGPMFGMLFVNVFGSLTDGVLKMFIGSGADGTAMSTSELLGPTRPTDVAGGDFVLIIVYLVMILGLLVCVLTLITMLVTLYMSGFVFPLAWQYVTAPVPEQRKRAYGVIKVWVGILLSQPLMFLMLGFAFAMAGGALQGELPGTYQIDTISGAPTELPQNLGPGPFETLMGLLVAAVGLWMAAVSPVALSKFAPILPTGGGVDGPGLPTGAMKGATAAAGMGLAAAVGGASALAARAGGGGDAGGDAGASGGGGSDVMAAASQDGSQGAQLGAAGGPAGAAVGGAAGAAKGALSAMGEQTSDQMDQHGGEGSQQDPHEAAGSEGGMEGSGGGEDAASSAAALSDTNGSDESSSGAAGGVDGESSGVADSGSAAGGAGGGGSVSAAAGAAGGGAGAAAGRGGGSDAGQGSGGGRSVAGAGSSSGSNGISGLMNELAESSTGMVEQFTEESQ